jgi:hypothetical protein
LVGVVLACNPGFAQTGTDLLPEKELITLRGKLVILHTYGPPGYGEDKSRDAHVTILLLKLKRSINIPCNSSEAADCKATKDLRMFFEGADGPKRERAAYALANQNVVVTGTLRRGVAAGEYTPVVVIAESVGRTEK